MTKKIYSDDLKVPNRSHLDRIAFYGRTLSEYLLMFGINDIDHLNTYNTILDCPSGASSFVAESSNNYEINTVGCDPLFGLDSRVLRQKGEEDIEYVTKRVSLSQDLYNWNFYLSIDCLKEYRKRALVQFISDYSDSKKRKRYIKAKLPKLPFDDKSFELVLSGHFLFTYSYKFDFSFILSSILELFRVCANEVRIYPLQKSSLQPYDHLQGLLYTLKNEYRIACDMVPVLFEFQKGSNLMLRLRRYKGM